MSAASGACKQRARTRQVSTASLPVAKMLSNPAARTHPSINLTPARSEGLSPGGLIRAHGAYSGASACSCACKYARYQDSSPCTMLAGVSRVVFTVCESVLWSLNGPNSLLSTHHTLFHAVCAEQSGAMSARNAGSQGSSPAVHRRVTPWRELTRDCSLRPGGASLLAKTGRSEQGGD